MASRGTGENILNMKFLKLKLKIKNMMRKVLFLLAVGKKTPGCKLRKPLFILGKFQYDSQ